jgi:HEPN domain-containing protein
MDESANLLRLAVETLESAKDNANRTVPRLAVAFAEARHALELGCKVRLLQLVGEYPRRHDVAGDLFQAGGVPPEVDARRLDRLLRQFTRGEYGVGPNPSMNEVIEMVECAQAMLRAVSQNTS